MLRAILISIGVVLVGLTLLLFSINRHPVRVDFLLFDIPQQPLSTMLVVFFVIGFLGSFFLVGWVALSYRKRAKRLKHKLAAADQEIFHLRRNAIQD